MLRLATLSLQHLILLQQETDDVPVGWKTVIVLDLTYTSRLASVSVEVLFNLFKAQ